MVEKRIQNLQCHIFQKKGIPEFSIRYNRENIELPKVACRSKTLLYEIKNLLQCPPNLFIVSSTKLAFNIASLKNTLPLISRWDFSDYILRDIPLILVFNEQQLLCICFVNTN